MIAARLSPTRYHTILKMVMAVLLAACTAKLPVPPAELITVDPTSPSSAQPPPTAAPAFPGVRLVSKVSYATTPRDYRRDGAAHLYARNTNRIFSGKLPPLLHAIGVIQVDINASGAVTAIRWMRAPRHAPEVMAEIERSVRSAAPFPAPIKMGKVTYTDTWLWHKSGQFQLDTLTEGQL